jgi:hypothetical protein
MVSSVTQTYSSAAALGEIRVRDAEQGRRDAQIREARDQTRAEATRNARTAEVEESGSPRVRDITAGVDEGVGNLARSNEDRPVRGGLLNVVV